MVRLQVRNASSLRPGSEFAFVSQSGESYGAWWARVEKVGGVTKEAASGTPLTATYVTDLGPIVPGLVKFSVCRDAAAREGLPLYTGFRLSKT